MRELDPTLAAAMDSGDYTPIVRAWIGLIGEGNSGLTLETPLDCIYYRLNGIRLDIQFYGDYTFEAEEYPGPYRGIILERGALINGVEYTITSCPYWLHSVHKTGNRTIGSGYAISRRRITNSVGHSKYSAILEQALSYRQVDLTTIATSFWKDYYFLATGASLNCSSVAVFLRLLAQKYLVYCVDGDSHDADPASTILTFAAASVLSDATESYNPIPITDLDSRGSETRKRQYIWRDQYNNLFEDGSDEDPFHNLGYLETGLPYPAVHQLDFLGTVATVIPNLKYRTGDFVYFDDYAIGPCVLDVTEVFDIRRHVTKPKRLPWRMDLRPLEYFTDPTTVVDGEVVRIAGNALVDAGEW